jgi:superfamily II DNA/RNA helicase
MRQTMAFLVPLLVRLVALRATSKGDNKMLVVVAPSRELAVQTAAVCSRLLEGTDLRCQALIGGANINRQLENLKKKKPEVVVGTAGRIAELSVGRGKLKLKGNTVAVVVDEVDCMLGPPHRADLEAILNEVGSSTQLVAASATGGGAKTFRDVSQLLSGRALDLRGFGLQVDDPLADALETSGLKKKAFNVSPLPSTVEHGLLVVPQVKMLAAIKTLLNTEPYPEAAIVFVNDGRRVELVCEKLLQMNIIAAPLHGEATKDDRSVVKALQAPQSMAHVASSPLFMSLKLSSLFSFFLVRSRSCQSSTRATSASLSPPSWPRGDSTRLFCPTS